MKQTTTITPTIQYRTTIDKRGGTYYAKSRVKMKEENRWLEFETTKHHSGGLYTTAHAIICEGYLVRFEIHGDYYVTTKRYPEVKRVTEKAITEAHAASMLDAEEFLYKAEAFYDRKAGHEKAMQIANNLIKSL